ncbi:TlpA family protein disulfide reductase [Tenacibaculum sp. nBUS_03]|uniref:TlpA family protein disulfide reductase n=1 Tax=Tenacibaculum sp. nBUS_03 TaxID=3395320 RepID=UPI003EC0531E
MKKLVLLALIGGIMLSCKKEEPVKDYLVISGSIDNFKKRDVKLQGFGFEKKIKFDKKNKTFTDTIKIEKDGYYKLIVNKKPINLYLTKTEDTKLIFDYKKLDAINFEGTNAAINQYFIKKNKIFISDIGNLRKLLALDEEAFLEKVDTYKNSLTDLAMASQLPESFLKKEIKNIEYEYLRDLYKYPKYHPLLIGDDEFVVSENFPLVSDKISYDNGEDYINSAYYREILEGEIKRKTNTRLTENGDFFLTYIETIHSEVSDSITKNDLLFNEKYDSNAQVGITYTDDPETFYNKFLKYSTNQSHKDRITEIYNSLKITAKGKPSPKFQNYENYDGSTTSLDDLLGKGKYVYIDVWATWCGFCKRETPLLKRLELQYHDKNIEFVSISVDNINAKEKWKQTIDQKEMGGVQLFADKSFGSEFIKKYAIKGLPRFIMIDPDGNIVSRNAPRPSNGEKLLNMFEELGI